MSTTPYLDIPFNFFPIAYFLLTFKFSKVILAC